MKKLREFIVASIVLLFLFTFVPKNFSAFAASCEYCSMPNYTLQAITPDNWSAFCTSKNFPVPTDNINVCRYTGLGTPTSGGYQCILPQTDTTCQAGTAQCDKISGCIGSGPAPSSCTSNGKACKQDTDCNGGSLPSACNDYHCTNSGDTICTPDTAGISPCTCKYTTTYSNPVSAPTCLKCASGCTATDQTGATYCVTFCGGTTKDTTGTTTQHCDPNTQICRDGLGCQTASTVTFEKVDPPCSGTCGTISTAFGMISTSPENFTKWLMGYILSFSGAILVILIILSGYQMMTSQGDPEKIKQARERLTSAIIGLFFIIFSFVFYQFITKDILHLPGFGA